MSTVTDRITTEGAAGGKIVTSRRTPAKTPYSRPEKRSDIATVDEPGNPNWLSGLISPAKAIVSSAGKIISFFGSDSPSSSDDYEENSDGKDEEVENDSSPKGESSRKVLSPSSRSSNKHEIEQLVMQEKFSRAEGDELINLIKSRIVDEDGSLDETAANLRTTAIMEAQKWLEQKRSGSKKKMRHGLDITTLASPTKFAEIGKHSPVDMAKSYMQSCPTWTSTPKCSEYGPTSPLGILNFKEEGTTKSTFGNSEMMNNSLSSGSWNILEELRKVRSKATEELLASTPLTNTANSSLILQNSQPEISVANNSHAEVTGIAESLYVNPQNVKQNVSISSPTGACQDGNVVQPMEHHECHEAQEAADLKSDKADEVMQLRNTTNGFPSTTSSLNAELDVTENAEPLEKDNGDLIGSVQRETNVHMEEEMVESRNNSSMHNVEVQPEPVLASKPKVRVLPERKSRGYNTRSRRAKPK